MYFGTKSYLKNNRNHTIKHTLLIDFCWIFDRELNDSIEYEKLSIDIELYILSSHVKK
jgi:hypothetical protein